MPKIRYADTAAHRLGTRRDIIRAAVPLFLSYGLAAVSMEQVASAVGVGRTTLYNYFRHKEEILLAYLKEGFARVDVVEQHPGVRSGDPALALRSLVELTMRERTARAHAEYERLFAMLVEEASPGARRAVQGYLEELLARVRVLAEGILERGTRAGLWDARPAGYYAAVLVAVMDTAGRQVRSGALADADAACRLVLDGFLRMVGYREAPGAAG